MPDATEPQTDFQTAHVGIVHSTTFEVKPLLKRCDRVKKYVGASGVVFRGGMWRDCRVGFAQVGLGPERAALGTHALIDGHSPKWIVSAGFSGGLHSNLKVGQIVVADALRDAAGKELKIDLKMTSDPSRGLHVGKLLTIDHVAKTAAEKKRLGEETGALAVDMESATVAAVCRERKVRFMAVRVVSDDVDHDVPDEALTILSEKGAVQVGAAVAALLKRPGAAKDLWSLRAAAQESADQLATFLEGIIAQLWEPMRT